MSAEPTINRTYRVEGMTCEHCTAAVREEVLQVAGVSGVEVELDGGRLVVDGEAFTDTAIRAAVEEAGYALVDPA